MFMRDRVSPDTIVYTGALVAKPYEANVDCKVHIQRRSRRLLLLNIKVAVFGTLESRATTTRSSQKMQQIALLREIGDQSIMISPCAMNLCLSTGTGMCICVGRDYQSAITLCIYGITHTLSIGQRFASNVQQETTGQDWAFRKEYLRKVTSLGILADRRLTLSLEIAKNILRPKSIFIISYVEIY